MSHATTNPANYNCSTDFEAFDHSDECDFEGPVDGVEVGNLTPDGYRSAGYTQHFVCPKCNAEVERERY